MRCALLSLAIVAVAWFECHGLYPVSLLAAETPPQVLTLQAKDTIFFRHPEGTQGGELQQVLHVTVVGDWEKRGTFRVETGGRSFELDVEKATLDENRYVIGIPPVAAETLAQVERNAEYSKCVACRVGHGNSI